MERFSSINGAACKSILLIHDILPHFDCSGCDLRIIQVLKCLVNQGCHVSYFARSARNEDKYLRPLIELGIWIYYDGSALQASSATESRFQSLEYVLSLRKFDLVLLFNWFWSSLSVAEQYLDDIRKFSHNTVVAVLTDDQHWLREQQAADLSGSMIDSARARSYLKRETECYESADLVLTITEEDRLGLLAQMPTLKILVLPFAVEPALTAPQDPPAFRDRSNFLFLGGSGNRANQEAILWFCREVWPSIVDRLPEATLNIAGFGTEELSSIERWVKNVRVLGHVPDLEPLFHATRVFVCPVLFGTGLKTKNLISMQFGVPLVTTLIGSVGMALTDKQSALIANTANEFSEKAVELYTNSDLWHRLAKQSHVHIGEYFALSTLARQTEILIQSAGTLVPKSFDPAHKFSIRVAEDNSLESTFGTGPLGARSFLRTTGLMELARRLLCEGQPHKAREQLYDLFSFPLDLATTAWICKSIEVCCTLIGADSEASEWHQEAEDITLKIIRLEMAAKRARF